LERDHARARSLKRWAGRLYISPATLLELQFLLEVGRIRLCAGVELREFSNDPRWALDDPPAAAWFEAAREYSWTHDPFDRLLVAHAQVRGWRLATGDGQILEQLSSRHVLEL
jgi:PIN domain nuclease of toxin-antitoxin system